MSEEPAAKKSDSTIFYFLVGLGLGSLISVLFAPKSGDETRKYLSEKLKDGSAYTQKKAHELKKRAAAAVDAGREAYQQEIAKTKAAGTED